MTDPMRRRVVSVSGGLEMHVSEVGEGSPVLLLHGSGPGASGESNFAENMGALAAAGFRAIAVDLFGFGQSSKPADRTYDLGFQVSGLTSLMDRLDLPSAAVIGNSMGGAVAMRLALDRPDLVSKLVLLAPGGLGHKLRYLAMPGIRAMMWTMLGPGGPTERKLRDVFALQLHDPSVLSDEIVLSRLSVAKTQPRQVYRTLKLDNLVPRLHQIRCPTLVFWGAEDNFCPVTTAHHLAERIPVCRVILVSKCGHWVQVERRALFDRECAAFLAGKNES